MKTIYNRIFMLTMAIMMSLSIFAYEASIGFNDIEIDGILYHLYIGENTSASAYTMFREDYTPKYSGDIIIPSSVTYEVGYTWPNDDKYKYSKVTFPVMWIKWQSFAFCENVTSVKIPNSVIEIDEDSFWDCGLSSVTIPCTAIIIEGNAFHGCKNLTSVTNLSYYPQNSRRIFMEEMFEVFGDLHVLKGRKQAYHNSPRWNKFNIIDDVEITPTMVKETIDAIDNVQKVYANDPIGILDIIKPLITNARCTFNALSKEQQAQVKNINLLIEAEETYGESTTGVANINSDNDKKDGKYLENGKIVIVKNGKKFNINGLNE